MALKPHVVDKQSPFLGEDCALCKQPFAPGDEIIICPEDAARHHSQCWRANGNKCSAYGCSGRGVIEAPAPPAEPPPDSRRPRNRRTAEPATGPRSKVQTMPSSSFHCAQSCLLIAIGLAILLFAVGCFGLWAIADYIMLERLHWEYRAPLRGGMFLPDYAFWVSHWLIWLGVEFPG
jgi:hypothetical protein